MTLTVRYKNLVLSFATADVPIQLPIPNMFTYTNDPTACLIFIINSQNTGIQNLTLLQSCRKLMQ